MFLEDGIALVRGGSIVGRAHGRLPAMTSHQRWWFCQNPSTRKFATEYWKSQKSRKIIVRRQTRRAGPVIEAQGGERKLREQR